MTEDQLEHAITQYLNAVLPIDCVHFHIPNAGKRKMGTIVQMKRAGLKAGMPDRGIVYRRRIYFLEAKKPAIKGKQVAGVLSRAQKNTITELFMAGAEVKVVWSIDDVQAALDLWGIPRKDAA